MSESLNSDQQQQLLFMMLLQQHEQIAMMGLGKLKSPMTDKIERDLKSAKYAIDTLVMLEKFTSGNLSRELSNYLTQILTNLRLNYADEKKKDAVGAPKSEESPKKARPDTSGEEGTKSEGSSKNGDSSKSEKSSKSGDSPKDVGNPKKGENPRNEGSSKSKGTSKKARPDTSGEDSSKEGEK